jgi:hypothetical protein
LSGTDSGNSYAVTGVLGTNSSLALSSNATNKNVDGLNIIFRNTSGKLVVTAELGTEIVDISSSFDGQDVNNLNYFVDIHNDETPAHVLVWSATSSEITEESALFNSEEDGEMPGNGKGSFWGIILDDARVSNAVVSEPRFEEE